MSRGSKVLSGTDKRGGEGRAARRGAAYDEDRDGDCVLPREHGGRPEPGRQRGENCSRRSAEHASNHDFAHAKLADVLQFVRGDFAGAEAGYKEAIRIAKGRADPAVHLHYGMLLRSRPKNKDLRGAEREYKTALKLDEGNADAHNNLGDVVVALRDDLEQAARHYRAALARDATRLAGWNLFVVLERQGDLRGAAGACAALARGAARGTDARPHRGARERLEELEAQLGPGPAASAVPAAEAKPADGERRRSRRRRRRRRRRPPRRRRRAKPTLRSSQDFDRPRRRPRAAAASCA